MSLRGDGVKEEDMEPQPRGYKKVVQLIDKGATIPNPSSLHIGDEVDLSRVAAKGLTIYPGCRIYGAKTVISPGVTLGAEGPVTIEDCALGPKVEIRGGYCRRSVFLERASMGLGAEVREGCLLEEEASGAHAVGLKQTILFPFVTVGSLVNFCDCLMAGGTSRAEHSEVGSSYVHFNYTPDGDKATASLFGDVSRGVMLNQPPIFLGGQGGAVGPRAMKRGHLPFAYKNMGRTLRGNVAYLANLAALEEWYRVVRHIFFARQEMGELIYSFALETLSLEKQERAMRLQAMVDKSIERGVADEALSERVKAVCSVLGADRASRLGPEGEAFLAGLLASAPETGGGYLGAIQSLAPDLAAQGSRWLQGLVDGLRGQADELLKLGGQGGPTDDVDA
jgi:bifunctional UDP-N-acetylglucosamine pyrophosphorylase/glucosamine-1-phosphate N-acetyltransferase